MQQRPAMARRPCGDASAMAGQVVLPTRVFAGRIRLGAESCAGTLPHVSLARGGHWSAERNDHTPARRLRRVRPYRVADPVHAGQALSIWRHGIQVEDQGADLEDAGVGARRTAGGVARWRPAATGAIAAPTSTPSTSSTLGRSTSCRCSGGVAVAPFRSAAELRDIVGW